MLCYDLKVDSMLSCSVMFTYHIRLYAMPLLFLACYDSIVYDIILLQSKHISCTWVHYWSRVYANSVLHHMCSFILLQGLAWSNHWFCSAMCRVFHMYAQCYQQQYYSPFLYACIIGVVLWHGACAKTCSPKAVSAMVSPLQKYVVILCSAHGQGMLETLPYLGHPQKIVSFVSCMLKTLSEQHGITHSSTQLII